MKPEPHSEVVIVQRRLIEYRVPLFEALRMLLAADGVRLRVLHGDPTAEEASRSDTGHLAWAERLPTRYLLGERVCWQPFAAKSAQAKLVIIGQDERPLYNLWAWSPARPRRIGLWGRGVEPQSVDVQGWQERLNRSLARRVQWWFTSTEPAADLVRRQGFARDRITNLENASDTRALAEDLKSVTLAELDAGRRRLGLKGARVGLFLGSLCQGKRLPFLLQAAEQVVQRVPSFRLLIAGDGPERAMVESAAQSRPWLRYIGRQQGHDKAIALRQSELMLNPGRVGIGILDAYAAGIAFVTTNCPGHGPELAYLRSGESGLMTQNSVEAFARGVLALLQYESERRRLGLNGQHVASHFTIENMAQRFRHGIHAALRV